MSNLRADFYCDDTGICIGDPTCDLSQKKKKKIDIYKKKISLKTVDDLKLLTTTVY